MCFQETFGEGLDVALGLLEGAYLGASSIFLRPLTGYTSSRITFRREEASLRLLRAPQLTSYTGIYRAQSLALSGEQSGTGEGKPALWRGPKSANAKAKNDTFLPLSRTSRGGS